MERKWWQDKVAYQIYPKSFYDSNNDGIGDIPGIIAEIRLSERSRCGHHLDLSMLSVPFCRSGI